MAQDGWCRLSLGLEGAGPPENSPERHNPEPPGTSMLLNFHLASELSAGVRVPSAGNKSNKHHAQSWDGGESPQQTGISIISIGLEECECHFRRGSWMRKWGEDEKCVG